MVNTEIPNASTLIDPVALERTKNDIVVRNRTLVERDFNEWYTSLLTCDKTLILDKIPFPYEGWTLQNQCPEWYSGTELCTSVLLCKRPGKHCRSCS